MRYCVHGLRSRSVTAVVNCRVCAGTVLVYECSLRYFRLGRRRRHYADAHGHDDGHDHENKVDVVRVEDGDVADDDDDDAYASAAGDEYVGDVGCFMPVTVHMLTLILFWYFC